MQPKSYIFGEVRKFAEDVEKTRTVEFIISSNAKDRHKSRVNMDGWSLDNFNRNPIVGYQHNVYGGNLCTPDDPDDVVGSGRAWIEESAEKKDSSGQPYKLLVGSVTFEDEKVNPKAEKIFRKVLAGTLRATSVGFMEVGKGEWKKDLGDDGKETGEKTYYFKGQELLEFSIVNIPSNPEAVGRALEYQQHRALQFIQRFMPDTMSIADIKKMSVGDVLDMINGKVSEPEKEQVDQINKSKYERKLKNLKLKTNLVTWQ